MDLVEQNGMSDHASDNEISNSHGRPSENTNISQEDSDSECPTSLPGNKGIKFSASDITQLKYDSMVAQYNNWLTDIKTTFDGDLMKFSTSCKKIILAIMILDKQLKTVYNSVITISLILSKHWRKFECWLCDTVLHKSSDKLKLSNEYTFACQKLSEDSNKFYI